MASASALLIGLSRQTALGREADVVANNLANINTTGFKRDGAVFETYLTPGARDESFLPRDRQLAFVLDRGLSHDFTPGAMKLTGNELDVAIQGEGFFAIETPQGERYTRNGAFTLNAQRELVTSEGFRVLGDRGPITFTADDKSISIAADGTVSGKDAKGRLRLVKFDNPQRLERVGAGLFAAREPAQPAAGTRVSQGTLEGSNVNGIAETSRLLEVSRAYQDLSGLLQRADDLRRTAIERLGQVQA